MNLFPLIKLDFRRHFPTSTLSQALQSDPDLEAVNLDLNILPSTLNLIPSAINDIPPPEDVYDQASADQLATSTGIPYLSLMIDPQYPTFLEMFHDQYPGKSPTDITIITDPKAYDNIVGYAILSNWPRLLQYFFSLTPLWQYKEDQGYLKESRLKIMQLISFPFWNNELHPILIDGMNS